VSSKIEPYSYFKGLPHANEILIRESNLLEVSIYAKKINICDKSSISTEFVGIPINIELFNINKSFEQLLFF
jgi:hypothetical protein